MTSVNDYKRNHITNYLLRFFPLLILFLPVVIGVYQAVYDVQTFFLMSFVVALANLELTASMAYYAWKGISSLPNYEKIDYLDVKQTDLEQQNSIRLEEVEHFVIIPNYKEPINILQETLDSIAQTKIAKNQISIILAMEEREEGCEEKAKLLCKQNESKFKRIFYAVHPDGISGEWKCKSANEQWAFQKLVNFVQRENLDPHKIVLTTCDADSWFHAKYFEALTAKFCCNPERYTTLWQAPSLCLKNYFEVPAVMRVLCTGSGLYEMSSYMKTFDEFTLMSSYSLSYALCKEVGGWDVDVISDDWRMGLKCFFSTNGTAKIEPIMLPIKCYSLEADTYWGTMKSRLDQAKRHCLGIAEYCYFLGQYIHIALWSSNRKLPPIGRTLLLWWHILRVHLIPNVNFCFGFISLILFLTGRMERYISPEWLNLWNFVNTACGVSVSLGVLFVFNRILAWVCSDKHVPWYRAIQWCVEWLALGPIALSVYTLYPTLYSALQIAFTSEQSFVVSQKPKEEMMKDVKALDAERVHLLE